MRTSAVCQSRVFMRSDLAKVPSQSFYPTIEFPFELIEQRANRPAVNRLGIAWIDAGSCPGSPARSTGPKARIAIPWFDTRTLVVHRGCARVCRWRPGPKRSPMSHLVRFLPTCWLPRPRIRRRWQHPRHPDQGCPCRRFRRFQRSRRCHRCRPEHPRRSHLVRRCRPCRSHPRFRPSPYATPTLGKRASCTVAFEGNVFRPCWRSKEEPLPPNWRVQVARLSRSETAR